MVVPVPVVVVVIMVVPVVVALVARGHVIMLVPVGTAFDGEVQGMGAGASPPQRAAKPTEYASASRRLVRRGLREGPLERGSVIHSYLARRI